MEDNTTARLLPPGNRSARTVRGAKGRKAGSSALFTPAARVPVKKRVRGTCASERMHRRTTLAPRQRDVPGITLLSGRPNRSMESKGELSSSARERKVHPLVERVKAQEAVARQDSFELDPASLQCILSEGTPVAASSGRRSSTYTPSCLGGSGRASRRSSVLGGAQRTPSSARKTRKREKFSLTPMEGARVDLRDSKGFSAQSPAPSRVLRPSSKRANVQPPLSATKLHKAANHSVAVTPDRVLSERPARRQSFLFSSPASISRAAASAVHHMDVEEADDDPLLADASCASTPSFTTPLRQTLSSGRRRYEQSPIHSDTPRQPSLAVASPPDRRSDYSHPFTPLRASKGIAKKPPRVRRSSLERRIAVLQQHEERLQAQLARLECQ